VISIYKRIRMDSLGKGTQLRFPSLEGRKIQERANSRNKMLLPSLSVPQLKSISGFSKPLCAKAKEDNET
jgi:hypothetical protein